MAQGFVFEAQAAGDGVVFQAITGHRQTAVGVARQGHAAIVVAQGGGRVEEVLGVGVLVRVGGEAVGAEALGEAHLGVGGEVVLVGNVARAPAPVAVAVVLLARGVDAGRAGVEQAVVVTGIAGRVLAAGVEGQGQEAVVGQGKAFPAAELALQAVALVVAAEAVAGVAAVIALLEHDVDHPGDGVRTILGSSAIAQDLHPFDG
ncbi:hypothetical protein D3C79_662360 [compost metagenome]